ncbi:MAG: hypothetical protein CM15mP120_12630 [Pseudomonadota bacterium]|nr:MAG: hypothetical protein CM15mP120_12630 [Pseudomonadota bacterium]
MTEQPHSPGLLLLWVAAARVMVPALPVIDALLNRQWQIHFIGTRSGLEERLLGVGRSPSMGSRLGN